MASAAAIVLLGISGGSVEASSPSFALKMAMYAVATATHDQPAHVVNAADVSNAFDTFSSLRQISSVWCSILAEFWSFLD